MWFALLLLSSWILSPGIARSQNADSPLARGYVGVGTYATVSQFKDLEVTANGKVLLHKSLAEGMTDLKVSSGQWSVVDGALQQSSTQQTGMRVFTGDKEWTDYTVTVKARKISGNEGFYLIFRASDDRNLASFNVGGAGNTKAHLSMRVNNTYSEIGDSTPMIVEENRWYDVKAEVKGDTVTGYVDGKKMATAQLPSSSSTPPAAPARSGANAGVEANRGGGGGTSVVAPAVVSPAIAAKPVAEPMSMQNKIIYAGVAAIVIGLVAVWAMQFRNRSAGKPK